MEALSPATSLEDFLSADTTSDEVISFEVEEPEEISLLDRIVCNNGNLLVTVEQESVESIDWSQVTERPCHETSTATVRG